MAQFKSILLGVGCFAVGVIVTTLIIPTSMNLAYTTEQPVCETAPTAPTQSRTAQSNTDTAHSVVAADNTKMLIDQLQKKIGQLESALARSEQSLAAVRQSHSNPYDNPNDDTLASTFQQDREPPLSNEPPSSPKQPSTTDPIISKEQAEASLPAPFSTIMTDMKGKTAQSFNKFKDESQDYDWALTMENNIRDFISMHELAGDIDVASVICKTNICEIRVFERKERSWVKVLNHMTKESWWSFVNTASSGSSSPEFGNYAYVLVSKLP